MNVQLLQHTPNPEQAVTTAARLCYSASGIDELLTKIETSDNAKFVSKIIGIGHHSVLEHASFTFGIEGISRVTSHQLVRHRVASYCLSGDTQVIAFSHKKRRSPKRWTIKRLYEMSIDPQRKSRIPLIRLRSTDSTGILKPNKIKNIMYSGRQEVYEVEVTSGRKIKSTLQHRFLTNNGYIALGDLNIGDSVICNGMPAHKNKEWITSQYINANKTRREVASMAGVSDACLGVWIRRLGIHKPKPNYPNRKPGHGKKGMFSEETIQLLRLQKTGENNPSWLGDKAKPNAGRLRAQKLFKTDGTCEACGNKGRIERHHVNGDTLNNDASNLRVLCSACHKAHHIGQAVISVYSDNIISIKYVGVEDTYDIEMEPPNHNFVAEGFLVHNSQQSQRYVDSGNNGFVTPPSIEGNLLAEAAFETALVSIANAYHHMVELGIPPEDARYILPNATETKIIVTMNARELLHFFKHRCCDRAQWEIRTMANKMLSLCKDVSPALFEAAGAACVSGKCPEGTMTCGKPKHHSVAKA